MNTVWIPMIFAAVMLNSSAPPPAYSEWKQQRDSNLRAEKSWLTLVGLHWLDKGRFTIGSAANQEIKLAAGPKVLGTISRADDDQISLDIAAHAVMVDGAEKHGTVVLTSDAKGQKPTEVSVGSLSFFVINRSGRLGLRVRDASAKTRTEFAGIDYFGYSPQHAISARYEPYDTPRTLDVATIIGTVEPTPNPGRAHFEFAGKAYSFELLEGSDADHYFTIFGDKTNGKETYGMARFLTGKIDHQARTVELDFNRAYNPPCAFTEFATCPMPPASNRIAARVEAGEKAYRAAH